MAFFVLLAACAVTSVLVMGGFAISAFAVDSSRVEDFTLTWSQSQTAGVELGDDGVLTLTPEHNNNYDDGVRGTTATAELVLETARGEELAPGDVTIRLPRYLFVMRNGEPGGLGINSSDDLGGVPKQGEEGGSPEYYFSWSIDEGDPDDPLDDEIVLANYVALADPYRLHLFITYHCVEYGADSLASDYKDDSTHGFKASLAIQDDTGSLNRETDQITARIVTDSQLQSLTKKPVDSVFVDWNESWGMERPEDADQYVYVPWLLEIRVPEGNTQEYNLDIVDTPGNGGEVIGWSVDNATSFVPEDSAFTVYENWHEPSWYKTLYRVYVLVRYPRAVIETGQSVLFENNAQITLRGRDDASDQKQDDAQFTYEYVAFTYPPGEYGVSKTVPGDTEVVGGLDQLRGNDPVSFGYRVGMIATGGELTREPGSDPSDPDVYGKRPYTVEFIDDLLIMGGERLNPGDYQITSISVLVSDAFQQDYVRGADGNYRWETRADDAGDILTLQCRQGLQGEWIDMAQVHFRSERLYFKALDAETGAPSGQYTSDIDLPSGTTAVRIVGDTTAGRIEFADVAITVEVLPSEHVKEILSRPSYQTQADVYNVDSLRVIDADDSWVNAQGRDSIDGSLQDIVAKRDEDLYGAKYPQHADAFRNLTPVGAETLNRKRATTTSEVSQQRAKVSYTVDMYEIALDRFSDPLFLFESGKIVEQRSGTFYDLLPIGMYADLESVNVTASSPDRSDIHCETDVELVDNWRDTGRTMLIVRAEMPDGVTNWAKNIDNSSSGSGFTLQFDAYYPYESILDYGPDTLNSVAYMAGSGELIEGYADTGGDVTEHDLLVDLDGDGNPAGTLKNVVYAQRDVSVNLSISTEQTMDKRVRAEDDLVFSSETTVDEDGSYTYRIRSIPNTGTEQKSVVFYDEIEQYAGEDAQGKVRWYGAFESVDVSQLERRGAAPVVYYTTQDIDLATPEGRDLGNANVWSTTAPSDLSTVRAIAVDASKETDGSDLVLTENQTLSIAVHMRAPETGGYELMQQDAVALNDAWITYEEHSTADHSGSWQPVSFQCKPTTVHITGSLPVDFSFTKVAGSDNDATALPGATFALYRFVGEGIASDDLIDPSNPGSSWEQVGDAVTSDQNGSVTFAGLETGEYRLIETAAPAGYEKPAGQWRVTVAEGIEADPSRISIDGIADASGNLPPAFATSDEGSGTSGLRLPNYPPMQVPSSGGRGALPLMIGGAVLLAVGAGVLLVMYRRSRA